MSEDFKQIDTALASLSVGNIAFDVPTTMQVDEVYNIYGRVSASKTVEELEQELQQRLEGRLHYFEGAQIKIVPQVEALLSGQHFQILGFSPEKQPVGVRSETIWKWDVRPQRGGTQTLHLTVNAILQIGENSTRRTIRVFDKSTIVQVTLKRRFGDFVRDNWRWLWTVVVVPVLFWLWLKLRKRKQSSIGFRPEAER